MIHLWAATAAFLAFLVSSCVWLAGRYYCDHGKHAGASEGALLVQQLIEQQRHVSPRQLSWSGDLADDLAALERTELLYLPNFDEVPPLRTEQPSLEVLDRVLVGLQRL